MYNSSLHYYFDNLLQILLCETLKHFFIFYSVKLIFIYRFFYVILGSEIFVTSEFIVHIFTFLLKDLVLLNPIYNKTI